MGARWTVEIGRSQAPVWGKNYVPDKLMLLFTDEDFFIDYEQIAAHTWPDDDVTDDSNINLDDAQFQRVAGYCTTAGTLRKRLEIQGFSTEWVKKLSSALFDDEYDYEFFFSSWPEGYLHYPTGAALTETLCSRRGQNAAVSSKHIRKSDAEKAFLYDKWHLLLEYFDDPRFSLALVLAKSRSDTLVSLDLSGLFLGGYLEFDERPHKDARSRMAATVASSAPIIVISEGVSDERWLRRALEISVPEAAHYFRFLDFEQFKTPGGTDRVVSLTKGMAAAGVMNRIVAVLDNDTAGQQAARQLRQLELPKMITVVNLPSMDYLKQYPAKGPDGLSCTDINGRGASIEFMFGDDILRGTDGHFYPIRWQAFVEGANAYQGGLEGKHKKQVAQHLNRVMFENERKDIPKQVLDGCNRLADLLISAVDKVRTVPASEGSELSALWRNDPFATIEIS